MKPRGIRNTRRVHHRVRSSCAQWRHFARETRRKWFVKAFTYPRRISRRMTRLFRPRRRRRKSSRPCSRTPPCNPRYPPRTRRYLQIYKFCFGHFFSPERGKKQYLEYRLLFTSISLGKKIKTHLHLHFHRREKSYTRVCRWSILCDKLALQRLVFCLGVAYIGREANPFGLEMTCGFESRRSVAEGKRHDLQAKTMRL